LHLPSVDLSIENCSFVIRVASPKIGVAVIRCRNIVGEFWSGIHTQN